MESTWKIPSDTSDLKISFSVSGKFFFLFLMAVIQSVSGCSSGDFVGKTALTRQSASAGAKGGSADGTTGLNPDGTNADGTNSNGLNPDGTKADGTTAGPNSTGAEDGSTSGGKTPGVIDGASDSIKKVEPMLVDQLLEGSGDADGVFTVRITKTDTDGGAQVGDVYSHKFSQHKAEQVSATDLCNKKGDSYFKVEFGDKDGSTKSVMTTCSGLFSGSQKQVLQTGGGANNPEVTVDKGGCGIGTAVDRGKDNTFRFSCPNSAVHIHGLTRS